jgi:hypothetical protein
VKRKSPEALGPEHERAARLLADIRFYSKGLAEEGTAVQALPAASMALLEKAARGEVIPAGELRPVLEAAEKLEDHLGWEWLAIPYNRLLRSTTRGR